MHQARGNGFVFLSTVVLALAVGAPRVDAGWRSEGPFVATVVDLAVDPSHPDTVYVATHSGGVFRSDDFGRSWVLPGDGLVGWPLRWVEVDPATPSTLWAGVDTPGQPALWRSLDRGASWQRVTDETEGEVGRLDPTGARIAFAPSRPTDIWVPSTNLHFRSRDGGSTWSTFRVPGQDAYAIAVDPADANVVYAGGRGEKYNLSISRDGGATWQAAGRGIDGSVGILLVDPHVPSRLYAVYGFNHLVRSTDRGETFAPLAIPALPATADLTGIAIDPSEAKAIWIATEGGLYVSRDGGGSWKRSEQGTGRYLVNSVALDPRAPRRMLAASAGGAVYRSDDGGASWSPSRDGLAAARVERIYGAEGARAGAPLLVQTSVGLWQRGAAGPWTEVRGPFVEEDTEVELDGIVYDPRSPQTAWAFSTSRAWRSGDGGATWRELERKQPSLRDMMKGKLAQAQFNSFAVDGGNSKVLYAGSWSNHEPGGAVFKSTDAGASWKPGGVGVPDEAVRELRSAAPGVVLALVGDRRLFRTSDGGQSWAAVGQGLPETEIRELALDPTEPTRVFAASEEGLFRSADSGATFSKVGSLLAEEDVEAVVVAAAGTVFAGAFHGVFASTDGGVTWTAMNDGLMCTNVRALVVVGPAPARLYAGTAGGSVWSTELR